MTARVYQAVGSWAAVRSSKQVVCRPHLHCAEESQKVVIYELSAVPNGPSFTLRVSGLIVAS
ncbi:MAG: hypothetical protein DMF21_06525 [Verrucomicrobia bacterium]|nr:MAG: hypothetical protein DMF21_06525 [Verrucomicrobiota bacterium]